MRMTLDIDVGVQPITGRLQLESGPECEFAGMLELISLLEAVRKGADGADPHSPDPG